VIGVGPAPDVLFEEAVEAGQDVGGVSEGFDMQLAELV